MTHTPAVIEVPATLEERATAIRVYDDETHAEARAFLADVAALKKQIENELNPGIESAHRTHKLLTAKRNETLKPLEDFEKRTKSAILAYVTEKAAQERAAQAAEQARIKAEADAKAAEAAAILEQAEIAARVGATDTAAELTAKANAVEVEAFTVSRAAEKIKPGKPMGTREIKRWRVTDKSLIPREYLMPDAARLDFEANRNTPIDGIEYYTEHVLRGRG